MTTQPVLNPHEARRAANRLLEVLQRRREPGSVQPPPWLPLPWLPGSDATAAGIEQAKGALMMWYGVDSHQALAVLVRWGRVTHTPVRTVAETLLHGICEGNPQTRRRQRPLVRWLTAQLREGDPDLSPVHVGRVEERTAIQTPRS